MAVDADGGARRRRRYGRTVTYGLVALVALAPLTTIEAWPFTSLQLFSHARSPVSTRYDAIGVAPDGRAVRLRPGWTLQRTKRLTPAEMGPDLCRRWVRLARGQLGPDVVLVRSERRTYRLRHTADGVDWRPAAGDGPLDVPAVNLLRRLDRRLLASGSAHRLAAIRLGFAAIIGWRVALGPYVRLTRLPDAVIDPPVLLGWLHAWPSAGVIVALQLAGVAAAGAVVLGRTPRTGLAVAWICLLLLAGLRTSAGKILHNDVLLLLCALPIVLAPAVVRWRDRTRRADAGWPVRAACLVMASVYFWSGVQKLRYSGLAWVTGGNMRWVLYQGATKNHAGRPDLALWLGDRPWLTHVLAGGAIAIELLAPLLLATARTRTVLAVGAVTMHLVNYAVLGLDYWAWIATVLVLLVPWDRIRGTVAGQEPTDRRVAQVPLRRT